MTTRLPLFGRSTDAKDTTPEQERVVAPLPGNTVSIVASAPRAASFGAMLVRALVAKGHAPSVVAWRSRGDGTAIEIVTRANEDVLSPLRALLEDPLREVLVPEGASTDAVVATLSEIASGRTLVILGDPSRWVRPSLAIAIEGAPAAVRRIAARIDRNEIDLLLTDPGEGAADAIAASIRASEPRSPA